LKTVKSIEAIDRQNIIDTACKPVLVFCSDLEFYYCKYNTGFSSAEKLLREYLGVVFLNQWGLSVPDFAFVKVANEHVPETLGIPYHYFKATCFGSQKIDNTTEANRFLEEINSYQKQKFKHRNDYLKISLFDIWVGNDDRNHNNYNLLVESIDGNYRFVPIDHEAIFNTGNLNKGLYTITEESSLITAPLCSKLFMAKELTSQNLIAELKDYFYLCVSNCKRNLTQILKQIPPDWQIDKNTLESDLNKFLFTKEWIEESWGTFIQYLQFTINKISNN